MISSEVQYNGRAPSTGLRRLGNNQSATNLQSYFVEMSTITSSIMTVHKLCLGCDTPWQYMDSIRDSISITYQRALPGPYISHVEEASAKRLGSLSLLEPLLLSRLVLATTN